uniref:RT_RNaseH_2 domain-containing protein n=1 Tax=Heterorhabditis bacteriophora TaxID=37862 RepID=A0A1I7WI06_HETBA
MSSRREEELDPCQRTSTAVSGTPSERSRGPTGRTVANGPDSLHANQKGEAIPAYVVTMDKSSGLYISGSPWVVYEKLFRNYLTMRRSSEEEPFEELITILRDRYVPRKLILAEKVFLMKITQQDYQSMEDFFTDIQKATGNKKKKGSTGTEYNKIRKEQVKKNRKAAVVRSYVAKTYTNYEIEFMGKCTVDTGHFYKKELVVKEVNGKDIIKSLNDILVSNKEVFNSELGMYKKAVASLKFKEGTVIPKFCKTRPQASAIVAVVPKSKGKVRICGDFKDTELPPFLGMFILNLSTKNGVEWKWTSKEQKAVDGIREVLAISETLAHYNPREEIVLATDASNYGLGAVLYTVIKTTAKFGNSDGLSSLPNPNEKPFIAREWSEEMIFKIQEEIYEKVLVTAIEIAKETSVDVEMRRVKENIQKGWPNKNKEEGQNPIGYIETNYQLDPEKNKKNIAKKCEQCATSGPEMTRTPWKLWDVSNEIWETGSYSKGKKSVRGVTGYNAPVQTNVSLSNKNITSYDDVKAST